MRYIYFFICARAVYLRRRFEFYAGSAKSINIENPEITSRAFPFFIPLTNIERRSVHVVRVIMRLMRALKDDHEETKSRFTAKLNFCPAGKSNNNKILCEHRNVIVLHVTVFTGMRRVIRARVCAVRSTDRSIIRRFRTIHLARPTARRAPNKTYYGYRERYTITETGWPTLNVYIICTHENILLFKISIPGKRRSGSIRISNVDSIRVDRYFRTSVECYCKRVRAI